MDNGQQPTRQRLGARSGEARAVSDVIRQRDGVTFSPAEQEALMLLRWGYRHSGAPEHDGTLTHQELMRLRFVRWLYRTGKLTA